MPRIHHEVSFAAAPAQVYRALMDSAEHARFTGAPAEISGDEGGAFTCHGGFVHGRNLQARYDRLCRPVRLEVEPEGQLA